MTSKQLFENIKTPIAEFEAQGEAEAITLLILEQLFHISRMDVLVEKEIDISSETDEKLKSMLDQLKSGQPIQHILGKVEFYGRQFLVNPNVLIPRRETEELVHLILERHSDLSEQLIVDVGTGSGIIPITIAKERKHCEVYGIDISSAALATAKRNADLNHAQVSFIQADILTEEPNLPKANIWVSNPPYVMEKEKAEMEAKVYDHDPTTALFVPDHDALIFYERIAQLAYNNLILGGELYFEINELFGKEVKAIMGDCGFKEIVIKKDMQEKDRFVLGRR
ncbi:peptide chain release factor N(5)-glutamine methyltransferase [Marivirga harenae]|uniref:peptide chain release factor N(5)-glutamine methyltransferase n=1 Tax=Marivirga harenae TaxID=2010992 RepID=UPI0026DEA676|nr:peptide chain release factor N(5)-glutamine methyltransferase [Marivirga harenae]WKV10702.1 peptide chain release factor N(5)-glutamine methyltransferase [Marivirga harenae]